MNIFGKLLRSQFGWALIAGAAIGTAGTVALLNTRTPAVAQAPASVMGGAELSSLASLDLAGTELVEQVSPSVVLIRTNRGEGSGVVYRSDGYLLTNAHVVAGADEVSVTLHDGREIKGKVIRDSDDSLSDLALVKIDADGLVAARFADSASVRPGQIAVAIGAPFGLAESVSFGHVSALGRQNLVQDNESVSGVRGYFNMIQTDAAINPGNSGGPLLNYKGEVIGINSAINSMTGYSSGVGFAIPSNTAKIVADQLLKNGAISRSYLGVEPANLKGFEVKKLGIESGAIIRRVEPNSPAAKAGLNEGDIVVEIGSHQVRGEQDLRDAMLLTAPGKAVDVRAIRDGVTKNFQVTPSKRPDIVAQNQQRRPSMNQMPFPEIPGMPDFPEPPAVRDRGRDESPVTGPVRLGVTVRPMTAAERASAQNTQGVMVDSVDPGSPADEVGIEKGMIITQLGDAKIKTPDDLKAAISKKQHGDSTLIGFAQFDGNSRRFATVTIQF
jgi:serine protease Do